MAFHDVTLPENFQYGSSAGAGFATIIQTTASGHEVRVARQTQPVHRLSLQAALWTKTEAKALKAFAIARRGSFHSFKVKDFSDYTSNDDGETAPTNLDQEIGTGDGVETTFQIVKVYNKGGDGEFSRVITLPEEGTVVVSLDGVNTTAWTLNGAGEITFSSPPGVGVVIKVGFKFFIAVRFAADFDKWARLQADAFEVWSLPLLDVIEVLNEVEFPERWEGGGGRNWGDPTQAVQISWNDGCHQRLNPAGAISLFLPVPETARTGRDLIVVSVKAGAAGSVQVRDDQGTALGSAITEGQIRRLHFTRISSTTGEWVAG